MADLDLDEGAVDSAPETVGGGGSGCAGGPLAAHFKVRLS